MNITKAEQLELITLHDDIHYVEIPEDLAEVMKDTGSYQIDKDLSFYTETNLCYCGTTFKGVDYKTCPICQNKKFKIQKVNMESFINTCEGKGEFVPKRTKFGERFIFERLSDEKVKVFTNKQYFTYNWITKEIEIEDEKKIEEYGFLVLEGEDLYFLNKKNEVVNILKFISLINTSSLVNFIKIYNEFFPKKPLPILPSIKKLELKRMIASHKARIIAEYFNEHGLYESTDRLITDLTIKKYEEQQVSSKEMFIHPTEENKNIFKSLGIPKSVLKHIKTYFDEYIVKFGTLRKDLALNIKASILTFVKNLIVEYDEKPDKVIKLFDLLIVSQKRNVYVRKAEYAIDQLYYLINDKNHQFKDLIRYIEVELQENQKLNIFDGIKTYHDYVNMSEGLQVDYTPYHKSVEKAHDIRAKDYTIVRDKQNEKLFTQRYNKKPLVSDKADDYVFIAPKNPKDLVKEGQSLHHCVASYTDKVINGTSLIYFMRDKTSLTKPLVTIEVWKDKSIYQARGNHNRNVSKEESKAIRQWAKDNGLVYTA